MSERKRECVSKVEEVGRSMQQGHHGSPWAHGLVVIGVSMRDRIGRCMCVFDIFGIKGVRVNETYSCPAIIRT